MRYKVLLWVLLVWMAGDAFAQSNEQVFRVNFKSDEYALDADDYAVLNTVLKQINVLPYTELLVKAHTDNDASDSYNNQLSQRRAQSVKTWLQENGVGPTRLQVQAFGEKKPIDNNSTATGKAANRRVDIFLYTYAFQNTSGLLSLLGANRAQHFSIRADKPACITSKGGVQVKIPAHVFIDENGKEVSGEIDFSIEDILKPGAMTTQQVSTMANGRLLESGGMFQLKAMQNGKELKVKEGNTLDVNMPAAGNKKDMQVFVPQVNAQGVTEWTVTPTAFALKPKKQIPLPYIQYDEEKLKSFRKETEELPDVNPVLQYQPLARPVKPLKPRTPYKIYPATRSNLFKWYDYLYTSGRTMDEAVAAENIKRTEMNERNMKRFERSLQRYVQLMEKYREDSSRFENEYAQTYKCWLDDRYAEISELKNKIEIYMYNRGLERMALASAERKLTQTNQKSAFVNFCSSGGAIYYKNINLNHTLNNIDMLKRLSLTDGIKYFADRRGRINLTAKYGMRFNTRYAYQNNVALSEIESNETLRNMLNRADYEITEKRLAAGIYNISDMQQIYAAALPQTGMYNCDRFSDVPQKQMADVRIKAGANSRVSFYVPEINSFIYAYYNNKDKHSLQLPKGKDVIMVVIGLNEKGEPVFEQRNMRVTDNMQLEPHPEVASLLQIRKALEEI